MRRVQQTVEAKASGTRPRTSSPTMAGLVRQTQMPSSVLTLMRARQPRRTGARTFFGGKPTLYPNRADPSHPSELCFFPPWLYVYL